LNIKPCAGQISGTWKLRLHAYWRKNMIIGETMPTYKDWQGRQNSPFGSNRAISMKRVWKSRPFSSALVCPGLLSLALLSTLRSIHKKTVISGLFYSCSVFKCFHNNRTWVYRCSHLCNMLPLPAIEHVPLWPRYNRKLSTMVKI
jgi:hypothetical protein